MRHTILAAFIPLAASMVAMTHGVVKPSVGVIFGTSIALLIAGVLRILRRIDRRAQRVLERSEKAVGGCSYEASLRCSRRTVWSYESVA